MTREEAIKYIKSRCIGSTEERDGTQWSEAMWTAIEALKTPTEITNTPTNAPIDLISREEVLRVIITAGEVEPDLGYTHLHDVIEIMPSADTDMSDYCDRLWKIAYERGKADRPTGEWIKSNILPNGWHCSHCDAPVMTDDIEEMLFCPNCGSYNGGVRKNDVRE